MSRQQTDDDGRDVHAAVAAYVRAISVADAPALRTAFHPSASIIGNFKGTVEWLSVDAYVDEVLGAGLPPNPSPTWRLAALDITGDAALAKVEDAFGAMTFTDYLSLLKVDGRWTIVSKLYHLHD